MSDLDKNINKRFQYQKASSDDAEIETLWNKIEQELTEKPKRRLLFFPWFFGALFMSILIAGVLYTMGFSDDQELITYDSSSQVDQVQNKIRTEGDKAKIDVAKNDDDVTVVNKNIKSSNPSEIVSVTDNSLSVDINDKIKVAVNLDGGMFTKKAYSKEENNINRASSLPSNGSESNAISYNDERISRRYNSNIMEEAIHLDRTLSPVQIIVPKKFLLNQNTEPSVNFASLFMMKSLVEDINMIDRQNRNLEFEVGVIGGLNYSSINYNYTDDPLLSDLKNRTESGNFGWAYGLEAGLKIYDHWIIQTGLEFQTFYTKFNYTDEQIELKTYENQLSKIWLDGSDTLKVEYRNVTTSVTTSRRVVNYNKYTQLSIPMTVGYGSQSENFLYGLTVGASFNFIMNQSGKTIDGARILQTYDNNSLARPITDFNVGLRLSPFLGYNLNENMVVIWKPNFQFQRHSNPTVRSTLQLYQMGMNFGLQIKI